MRFFNLSFLGIFLVVSSAYGQNHGQTCDEVSPCNPVQKTKCLDNENPNIITRQCRCVTNAYWDQATQICRFNAGTSCDTVANGECTPDSTCIENGCQCNEGFHVVHANSASRIFDPKRICRMSLGTNCTVGINDLCDRFQGLICTPTDPPVDPPVEPTCQCQLNRIWSDARKKCVMKTISNEGCIDHNQCVDNAYCREGVQRRCECHSNYGPPLAIFPATSDGTCNILIKQHGEVCAPADATQRCADKFVCTNTRCECPQGSQYNGVNGADECLIPYNATCVKPNPQDLSKPRCGPSSFCLEGKCECNNNFGPNVNNVCAPIGLTNCQNDLDCYTQESSICNEQKVCECTSEFVVGLNNPRCRVKGNANCTLNQNCVDNALCTGGFCRCQQPGFEANPSAEGFCVSLNAGTLCGVGIAGCTAVKGLNCRAVGSFSTCGCSEDWEWDPVATLCRPKIFANCLNPPYNNPCPVNSICNSFGICECNAGYAADLNNEKCLLSYRANCTGQLTACNSDQGLSCQQNSCQCINSNIEIFDPKKNKCSVLQGYPCLNQENCISDATCNANQKCHCNAGFEVSRTNRTCIPLVVPSLVGSSCTKLQENYKCTENAECDEELEICRCKEGYNDSPLRRCVLSRYQETCSVSKTGLETCDEFKFLKCIKNQCNCEKGDGMEWDAEKGMCVVKVGGTCGVLPENTIATIERQLHCGKNVLCEENTEGGTLAECSCPGEVDENGVCQLTKTSGSSALINSSLLSIFTLVLTISIKLFN